MDHVKIRESSQIGKHFIPAEFVPKGKNEYHIRETQFTKRGLPWRHLTADEVEHLVKNGNRSDNWDDIYVTDPFDPGLIRNSEFYGMIRIGTLKPVILEYHDLKLPAGIYNSRIIACDIGEDVAVHHVRYLAHFIIDDRCMLANIDEMHTTDHAKFGNGIVKEGEQENIRIWLDVMNETGCRKILPFDGIIPADAYLWAKYRDDVRLQEKLLAMTQNRFDARRGVYGTVGRQTVIKNSRILKDVKIGDCCYIKGANKLKNLTINSNEHERTQIGEGVELVNGIIGYGCHIFYGVKAVRFVLGNHANLKYGARLIHSFLGANSTISCCEVLNNLIFPAHEQHHNNSFLIASVVLGQSNLAAGATIGSNHNSRANDNEIQAGRGFWPGLCSSVKHSCRFASFVLLAKGDYPAELDIPLPFSLLNNNTSKDRLEIMPAFWWLYNMYALARNSWKFRSRDKRMTKNQHIEFEALAPDTVEEIIHARHLLELWTGRARPKAGGRLTGSVRDTILIQEGRALLSAEADPLGDLEILGEGLEKSHRKAVILKPWAAYQAYGEMLHYYAATNLIGFLSGHPDMVYGTMMKRLAGPRNTRWINLGGQLVPEADADQLRRDIGTGKLKTWDDIHGRYDKLWSEYTLQKQKHACAVLMELADPDRSGKELWLNALDRAVAIQRLVRDRVYDSRRKDYDNAFRRATFRNEKEMIAAIGEVDDNSFIKQIREETVVFEKTVRKIKNRESTH
ncbi:DUF4954 family protein [bacterium]|nr:DUF4954 family protein [bacterium]